MGMAKGMLHGEVHNCGTDLAGTFAGMNQHLFAATDDSTFMTLFLGLFDTASRTLHWNSAGHGPVFWYRCRQGLIIELLPTAPPLSITSSETFMPLPPVTLEAGDILLLGTDGIWEACNPLGEMFGTSRLRQLVATMAPKSARQIHDAIMRKVFDFMSGARPLDDMTLMVIKVVNVSD
jgi:sigma-B regulation protein RsbU (phosphoserine phosphatase)